MTGLILPEMKRVPNNQPETEIKELDDQSSRQTHKQAGWLGMAISATGDTN